MFKVIIAGSRTFNNYALLKAYVDFKLQNVAKIENIEIVCGEAKGADTLGKRYAIENGYSVKSFPADWNTYGRKAGMLRNEEMADYADALIAFWDGDSRGTKNMIDLARRRNLKVGVKIFN